MRWKRATLCGVLAAALLTGGCQSWMKSLDRSVTGDPTLDPARDVAPVDPDVDRLYVYEPPEETTPDTPTPDSTSEQAPASERTTPSEAPPARSEPPAPASRPAPASPSGPPQTYTVQRGDTLASISRQFYGRSGRWRQIYEANRHTLESPGHIMAGQELVIP